ncbi:MAG: hypothetical protein M3209_07350 [Acidobacteriota bacterium]|nr:hypothetical protein [Acidobacteriota bacterium]
MKELNLPNVTLIALVASCFIQLGAQLFALVVVAGTVAEAPPRSFAMFQGEYGYNSSHFWSTVPPITFVLFIIALVTNWKTRRRNLLLLALTMFIVGGLVAGFFLEPVFDQMKAAGYRDEIDPVLQSRAAMWYFLDWAVWSLGFVAGLALLLALIRPVVPREVLADSSQNVA